MAGIRDTIDTKGRRLPPVSRRSLLVGATAAGGLALAWSVWPRDYRPNLTAAPDEHVFNAFLKIGDDGHISAIVPQCEMGQGVTTLLPQIMADELGADWRTVAVETAPINALYTNTLIVDEDSAAFMPRAGIPDFVADVRSWARREWAVRHAVMLTANSSSVRMFEAPCRDAAAQARALLMMAAARRWDADWQQCDTQDGFVTLGPRKLSFGELAAAAALLEPPAEPVYRASSADPLYGKDLTRLDLPAKVDGSANYAGDIRLPDMVYAAIRQGPFGATRLKRIDRKAGLASPGVLSVVEHERWVAAVARNWWAANRALDRFAPEFETGGTPISSDGIDRALAAALKGDGYRIARKGDVEDAMAGRERIAADYLVAPALHAPIETRTATAAPSGDRLRVWVATQAPAQCRDAIARATGLSPAAVTLFPMMAGGSFDACLDHSVAVQAAIIARQVKRPVQLCWSRAEEIMRDMPRAPARAKMTATLNAAGGIDALVARIAVPATNHEVRARLFDGTPADVAQRDAAGRVDAAAVEGAGGVYAIPHRAVDHCPADIGLPTARWRGNADSYTAFFTECFVDEMAARAGADALSYRMAMLGQAPLLARCLLTATSLGGWEGGLAGTAQGLACHSMRGSHIALMATARASDKGLQVEQLVAVVDAGRLVNPAIARQQVEGGLIFGLAAAVGATTDYEGGLATARKLHQIGLPRLSQTPQILIEFIDSDRDPGGIGEIGVPVVAPAVANAMFAATGRRIRRLPLSAHPL
ncbi:xanthine dehydrogenase family protein molybdopterin-binding subunit [Sphingopyxis granuli]|uniref:xanthine dehydrogenase family protein molybdopterin-binding subunit n=1 Tax=Sphingopyxis granuli TaxID=267128 RepID=UPI001BB0B228|nr:molybdopterin cofactor-binding domain-containing protein [Sphingopyxis granuli]QUM73282.1 xanthine dehydrogenase family protein molybdopterin-binding subunit [Sphingopyxis granuli]